MRKVYLGRHAKSSWDHPNLNDHDRPLNKRGKEDAPFMARMMDQLEDKPQLIITSSANRALSTAMEYKMVFFLPEDHFWIDKRVYHAGSGLIEEIVQEVPDTYQNVYIFGHNPTMQIIADEFIHLAKFSTAGVLVLETDIDQWSDFHLHDCNYVNFYSPKRLRNE